jgi:hypothetical protein
MHFLLSNGDSLKADDHLLITFSAYQAAVKRIFTQINFDGAIQFQSFNPRKLCSFLV